LNDLEDEIFQEDLFTSNSKKLQKTDDTAGYPSKEHNLSNNTTIVQRGQIIVADD